METTEFTATLEPVDASAPAPAMNGALAIDKVEPPAGWPVQLQVAVVFWLATGTVLALALSSGAGWLLVLIPIAIDYAWYLRTDRGLTVEFLADATWNRPAGAPSRFAPQESWRDALPTLPKGKAEPFSLHDLDIAATLRGAGEEISSRITVVRRRFSQDAKVDTVNVSRVGPIDKQSATSTSVDTSAVWRDAA